MSRPRSLRRRVVTAFSVFAVLLTVALLASFDGVYHVTEDMVLERQLAVEADELEADPDLLDQPVIEVGRNMTAYLGLDGVPEGLRDRMEDLGPGVHEFGDFDDIFVDEEVHVVVRELRGRPEQLYVVFEATRLLDTRHEGLVYLIAIGISLLIVGVVGLVAGRYLTGVVIQPVSSLAEELREGSLETLADRIDPESFGDEVGVLAEALAEAADRLGGFIARERQFTANASHELRTPIAVIRGAAEILETKIAGQNPELSRPLARIQRSVTAMEETIELFLALAREGELESPEDGCSVAEIVGEVVEENRRYLKDKPVGVTVQVPDDVRVQAPPRVLAVVLGNLVGNAFRRTACGSVTVGWRDGRVEVVDTGPGIPEEIAGSATQRHVGTEHGYGLGLNIAKALCDRSGWELEFSSAEGTGTCASLRLEY